MAYAAINEARFDDRIKILCVQINRQDTREAEVQITDSIVEMVKEQTLLRKIRVERRIGRRDIPHLSSSWTFKDYESSGEKKQGQEAEADSDIVADKQELQDNNVYRSTNYTQQKQMSKPWTTKLKWQKK